MTGFIPVAEYHPDLSGVDESGTGRRPARGVDKGSTCVTDR
jgi:hypothetical protein